MNTTYTWKINSLSVLQEPLPDTAAMSNFTILGTDGEYTGMVSYSVNLATANTQNFTPYTNVTQEQAISWTQGALGVDRVAAMETEVQRQIDLQKVPMPIPAPLPWQTPPGEQV
jgi:hypothetical protein